MLLYLENAYYKTLPTFIMRQFINIRNGQMMNSLSVGAVLTILARGSESINKASVYLAPGVETTLTVPVIQRRRLPTPYGNCRDDVEAIAHYGSYADTVCLKTCWVRNLRLLFPLSSP